MKCGGVILGSMTRQLFQRQAILKIVMIQACLLKDVSETWTLGVLPASVQTDVNVCGPCSIIAPADQTINYRKCLSWSQRLLHLLEANTTGKDCCHDLSVSLISDTLFNQFICMENDLPS